MEKYSFRPWGDFTWLMSKCKPKNYSFLGSLSTEERCVTSLNISNEIGILRDATLFEIIDPIDTKKHKELRLANKSKILVDKNIIIESHSLLEPINIPKEKINNVISESEGSIILDISTFPKRFFFPILKWLLHSNEVKDLIVTCTTPKKYTDESLSENPLDWAHLPTFQFDDPEVKFDLAIIGIGFMPLGLQHLLNDKYSQLEVKFFFPFPPGPPTYQRTWGFINQMNSSSRIDSKQILRVDSLSISDTFDKIHVLSDYGKKKVLLAPYGPKAMSTSMCLYASQFDSAVYYTQPTAYNPYYSTGSSKCYGYCIKLDGVNFYQIQ